MVNFTDVQIIQDANLLCLIRKYRIKKLQSRQTGQAGLRFKQLLG